MTADAIPEHAQKIPRGIYAAFAAVQLAMWMPFIPAWRTFIHPWRVELLSSILFGLVLLYLFVRRRPLPVINSISATEFRFIVCPMIGLVVWSAASGIWAPWWKSAVHHAAVWAVYLIFYLLVRQIAGAGREFGKALTTLVLTLVLVSLPAIFEYCAFLVFGGTTSIGMRFAKWGEQIVTLLPLLLVLLVRMRGRRFWLGLSAVSLLWLLVFCTFGRINVFLFAFGLLASGAAIIISEHHRRYFRKFAFIVLLLGIAPLPVQVFSLFSGNQEILLVTRLTDPDAVRSSNNFRKLMYSVTASMIAENPVLGVGADNFGFELNKYRAAYGQSNPGDANLAAAENEIPQHAHNEFLQIVAELGIVGGILILWLMCGIAFLAIRAVKSLRRGTLFPFAAVAGLGCFLISSLVSAYSFRVMQNGFVFFFVLAVAAKLLFNEKGKHKAASIPSPTIPHLRLGYALGVVACMTLFAYTAARISSIIVANKASQVREIEQSRELYEWAMWLDGENPDARFIVGMRLFRDERYSEAAQYFEESIRIGRAPSAEFSYLATSYSLAGDPAAAEQTFKKAADMYPQSPFVLVRYAALLRDNGKPHESAIHLDRAMRIDERAANTWWTMITEGPRAASERAYNDKTRAKIMDLHPQNSIYAVKAERNIRFPEEKAKLSF